MSKSPKTQKSNAKCIASKLFKWSLKKTNDYNVVEVNSPDCDSQGSCAGRACERKMKKNKTKSGVIFVFLSEKKRCKFIKMYKDTNYPLTL